MIVVKENKQSNSVSMVISLLGGVLAIGLFVFVLIQIGLIPVGGEGTVVTTASHTLITQKMAFSQTEITVQAGETIQLQLHNNDLFEHSFDIDAIDVHLPIGSRGTAFIEFDAPEPGVYQFTCNVPGHVEAGMTGKLIVE